MLYFDDKLLVIVTSLEIFIFFRKLPNKSIQFTWHLHCWMHETDFCYDHICAEISQIHVSRFLQLLHITPNSFGDLQEFLNWMEQVTGHLRKRLFTYKGMKNAWECTSHHEESWPGICLESSALGEFRSRGILGRKLTNFSQQTGSRNQLYMYL